MCQYFPGGLTFAPPWSKQQAAWEAREARSNVATVGAGAGGGRESTREVISSVVPLIIILEANGQDGGGGEHRPVRGLSLSLLG